jgi:N-acetylmuramoyl-L-alanine amidase
LSVAYPPRTVFFRFVLLFTLLVLAGRALAVEITALRSWRAPDNTRLVLDMSGPARWQVSPDSTPARLVVELEGVNTAGPLALPAVQPPLKSLRLEKSVRGQRLVIETAQELLPKIFQLAPNEKYSHRLVLDLYDKAPPAPLPVTRPPVAAAPVPAPADKPVVTAPGSDAVPTPAPPAAPAVLPAPPVAPAESAPALPVARPAAPEAPVVRPAEKEPAVARPAVPDATEKFDARRYRNIIVALDPGHGGEDPGAIGKDGSQEKHVTLAIARELAELLEKEPGITVVLTRTGDYFLPLQERRRLARYQHKADIFISIHADAAENRAARGASVFALSLKGAGTATSRFARMLAERENRADLIGGVAIEREDDILRNVLADMVVAGSLEHSLHMGRNILGGLDKVGKLHSPRVEQAGFAVLKEPGMVSLLVETGFISNPDEEKKLTSRSYQRELAAAIANGVRRYCLNYPAPGTYFAWLADKGRGPRVAAARATVKPAEEKAVVPKPAAAGDEMTRLVAAAGVSGTAAEVSEDAAPPAPVLVGVRPSVRPPAAPAPRRHKVRSGENLTRLASRYGVSMQQLREANRLRDDNVKIGQVLVIPGS